MGRVQQGADGGRAPGVQQLHRLQDALVLGDHMPDPAERLLVQKPAGLLEVLEPDVAQRPHAKDLGGEFARFPPGRVAAVGVGMGNPGVDDQQHQPRGVGVERHQPDTLVPAVEEDGVAGRGPERGGLVHDAGGRADEVVLRPLGGQDHVLHGEAGAR